MATVKVETGNRVCRISLNRAERLNALGEQVRTELHSAIRSLADNDLIGVVVIRGEGRSFSAGADLREERVLPKTWTARRIVSGRWQRLLDDLEALPQVTVAVLRGHVIGGAALLAAACDLRIGARDLSFSIPELAIGIPLTWAGLPRLVREIGLPRTRELVMTGRTVSGEEAHRWGLVQRLVEPEDLDRAADQLVSELAMMPAGPLAITKSALSAMGRGGLPTGWADPDLLAWSLTDPEAVAARADYKKRRLMKKGD